MYEDRTFSVVQTVCICDRCGLEMRQETCDGEWEERLTVAFRGGYHSEFGDGNLVELDLCQHCVRDLLGPLLRITQDDPFEPRHKPAYEARRAYQDYQLRERMRRPRSLVDLFRDSEWSSENPAE